MKYYTITVETPTAIKILSAQNESSAMRVADQFRDYFMSGKSNCTQCYIIVRNPLLRVIRKIHLHQG